MFRAGRLITPELKFGSTTVNNLAFGAVASPSLLASHFGALILTSGAAPLTISRIDFNPEPAHQFFTALKVARCSSLSFWRVPLGHETITPEFPILLDNILTHPFIEELSINHCALTDQHGVMIAEKLRNTRLKKLDLRHNFIGQKGATLLSASIGRNLQLLDLSKNRIEPRISKILKTHRGCNIIIED